MRAIVAAAFFTTAAATQASITCTASGAPASSTKYRIPGSGTMTKGKSFSCDSAFGASSMMTCFDSGDNGFGMLGIADHGEIMCHKYNCAKECDMCSGKAAGTVLTEPCSCQKLVEAKVASVPSNCFPNPKVPRGGPCAYSYQCASGFCCPQLKLCLTDSNDSGAYDLAPAWVKTVVGSGTCTSALGNLDNCACHDGVTSDGLPVTGFDQTKCSCKAEYMTHYNANTWVTCGTPDKCEDASTLPTTTPAPVAKCVATTTDGTACVFPFKLSALVYNRCTTEQNSGKYWCATGVDGTTGQYTTYGNCATQAPCTSRSQPTSATQAPAQASSAAGSNPGSSIQSNPSTASGGGAVSHGGSGGGASGSATSTVASSGGSATTGTSLNLAVASFSHSEVGFTCLVGASLLLSSFVTSGF